MSFVDSLMDMLKNGKQEDGRPPPEATSPRPGTILPSSPHCLTVITTKQMRFSSMPDRRASLWKLPRFPVQTSR